MKIGIILGTIRKNRKSVSVGNFILDQANKREEDGIEYELVDIKDFNLPLFDEALPPAASKERETEVGRAWTAELASYDAYIFVNAEYNRSIPGSLKNAIDYVGTEFREKSAAIVSYGVTGGQSSVDHLRLVVSRLGLNVVRQQPYFLLSDFDENNELLDNSKEAEIKLINWMIDAMIKQGN